MKTRSLGAVCGCAFALAVSISANAALVDRGGGLIYDTALNVTWQSNANLAAGNTFGVSGINPDGTMSWTTAQQWIAAMNTANYLGYSSWRLPTTAVPDPSSPTVATGTSCGTQSSIPYGYNCTGSELGELFYNELGAQWGGSVPTGNPNYSLFQNILSDYNNYPLTNFWSGTDAPDSSYAWLFQFSNGFQTYTQKFSQQSAWAVMSGDVAAVPLPAAIWLFGSGLLGLIGVAGRKARA
jgi:hypothetical protein